jgi:hypothetical protein
MPEHAIDWVRLGRLISRIRERSEAMPTAQPRGPTWASPSDVPPGRPSAKPRKPPVKDSIVLISDSDKKTMLLAYHILYSLLESSQVKRSQGATEYGPHRWLNRYIVTVKDCLAYGKANKTVIARTEDLVRGVSPELLKIGKARLERAGGRL